MRKFISTIAAVSLVAGLPVAANAGSSKQETIGVGSGAVLGAVAGGPVGFIVGAAIGAKIGDNFHKKEKTIDTLSTSLDTSNRTIDSLERDVASLNGDIDTLGGELERLQRIAHPEAASLMQAGIAMDLLFRTDEHVLATTTGTRLAELANTIASMPDIHVQLDGYADERGDETYNQALSLKRVEFVRDQLVAAGVDPDRINVQAHGESKAVDSTSDSFALERRVSLTLFIDGTPSFASNPD